MAARASMAAITSIPPEFKCPLTQDLYFDPYKTSCNHVFERLKLTSHLRKHLEDENECPTCKEKITSVVPDTALATRIQNEFVSINSANKDYFDARKQKLENRYYRLIDAPVLTDRSDYIKRSVDPKRYADALVLFPHPPLSLADCLDCLFELKFI